MDIALGCCAGGPGSIPTVGLAESSCNIQVNFLTLWSKVVGKYTEPDTIIRVVQRVQNVEEKILAMPSMSKHFVTARNGSLKKGKTPKLKAALMLSRLAWLP